MQATKCVNLHKRNLEKETDSIRKARAREERLEEISGKIERAKQKCIRTNYHEKVLLLNDLARIHHVFEPLYITDENHERREQGTMGIKGNFVTDGVAYTRLPMLFPRRAEVESGTYKTSWPEPKGSPPFGGKMTDNSNSEETSVTGNRSWLSAQRPRSHSWSAPQSPTSEASQMSSELQNKREYIAKLRAAAKKPCISDTMSSVTMGYSAFKRLLRNKRRQDAMTRRLLNSRFRSLSLDETNLSVIPEFMEESDAQEEASVQTDENNNNTKQNLCFSRHLPTQVTKRHLRTALSSPAGEAKPPDTIPNSKPRELTRVQNARKGNLSEKQHSSIRADETKLPKEEEKTFRAFDASPNQGIRFSRTKCIRFRETPKLLKPMGTGCFSHSFQTVT